MLLPIRIEDGLPIYTTHQIDTYGFPDCERYLVVREEIDCHPFQIICNNSPKNYKVHRYCRRERFRTTLLQLCGISKIETEKSRSLLECTLEQTPNHYTYLPPCIAWEKIREILKKTNRQLFYNRIPVIVQTVTNNRLNFKNVATKTQIQSILKDFRLMDEVFDIVKNDLNRIYFPSLRYVALRLMEIHGVEIPIEIPKCRTKSKFEHLEDAFIKLYVKAAEHQLDSLFP